MTCDNSRNAETRRRRPFPTAFAFPARYNNAKRGRTGAVATVVYIDSVFVLNAATDYLLLLITARLAGLVPRRIRYALAACAGGAYAAAAWVPGWAFLTAMPVKCAAGVGVCLIAFGTEEKLGRLTVLFFAVSCALAGGVTALGAAGADATAFLLAALGAW
ncbi:MAG: sigma-E processing peptidase SpoIIGA, partial [Oscillospiraceae bacterium]|nr:sigma-E processing peptidase SpoIIGA [Oscillospiraceae bacterium]